MLRGPANAEQSARNLRAASEPGVVKCETNAVRIPNFQNARESRGFIAAFEQSASRFFKLALRDVFLLFNVADLFFILRAFGLQLGGESRGFIAAFEQSASRFFKLALRDLLLLFNVADLFFILRAFGLQLGRKLSGRGL